jgi:hypothetical protein
MIGGAILVAILAMATEAAFALVQRATAPRLRSAGAATGRRPARTAVAP